MSHTINSGGSNVQAITATIVNYVVGGEQFTIAEFGIRNILGVILGTVPASANSLAVPLFPVLDAGKVKLFRFVAGVPTEIPATNNLNAILTAIILIQ